MFVDADDKRILSRYLKDAAHAAEESKKQPNRPVLSTPMKFSPDVLKIGVRLMDWGGACFNDKHLIEDIYTRISRPPEVILGADWDSKMDIWALGVLVSDTWYGSVLS